MGPHPGPQVLGVKMPINNDDDHDHDDGRATHPRHTHQGRLEGTALGCHGEVAVMSFQLCNARLELLIQKRKIGFWSQWLSRHWQFLLTKEKICLFQISETVLALKIICLSNLTTWTLTPFGKVLCTAKSERSRSKVESPKCDYLYARQKTCNWQWRFVFFPRKQHKLALPVTKFSNNQYPAPQCMVKNSFWSLYQLFLGVQYKPQNKKSTPWRCHPIRCVFKALLLQSPLDWKMRFPWRTFEWKFWMIILQLTGTSGT